MPTVTALKQEFCLPAFGEHGVPTLQLTTLRMFGPFNRYSCAKTLTPTLSPRERGPNGGIMHHDSISKTCFK